jgi:citronellol/citronellal dehydrogenase
LALLRATLRGPEETNVSELSGKIAIITGASRGMGKAIAVAFAERGAEVVLASKTVAPNPKLPGTLEDVAAEIKKKGGKAFIQATDVRDEEQIQALVAKTARELGGVDILINNAGALYWADVEGTPAKRFDLVMSVNARAAFLCASAVIPHMRKRGGGAIVNMSPPITESCTKGRVAYMISKFGMSMLTEGLAAEVAKDGITVHSLWPVTMIESQATIGHHLGEPAQWRTPQILVDATVALVTKTSKLPSGRSLYDEDVLESIGTRNFAKYACVPGTDPPRMRLDDAKGYWRQ